MRAPALLPFIALIVFMLALQAPWSASASFNYDGPDYSYDDDRRSALLSVHAAAVDCLPPGVAPAGRANASAPITRALPDDIARTFKNGQYTMRTLDADLIVHRYYGGGKGPIGGFLTRTKYSSPGRARQ